MIIRNIDIVGYIIDKEDVCEHCCTPDEIELALLDNVITGGDIAKLNESDEKRYCDRCKKQL